MAQPADRPPHPGHDEYAASAEYLHLLSEPMWTHLGPRLAAALGDVDPTAGPLLELGAGTGRGTDVVLSAVRNDVLAVEPSPALRGVLLARLADHGTDRVTVHPGGALDVPLPDRLAAVVGMHMIGHLAPAERAALWAALAARLAPGGPVIINVQPPDTPVAVPPFPWSGVTIGGLTYEVSGRARPAGPGQVRWRTDYRSHNGDRILTTATTEYEWWTASAADLATELAASGLRPAVDGDLVIAHAPRSS